MIIKPKPLLVDQVREVCDEWRYMWNLPPEVDKVFRWAVGHDVGISNARFETRDWADAFMAVPKLLQLIDAQEKCLARSTTRPGDYRCLKAIRGIVQASLGPDTMSDELTLLNRLIEAAQVAEEVDQ